MPGGTQVPVQYLSVFDYGALTLFGRLSHTFLLTVQYLIYWPYNPSLVNQQGLD